MRDEQMKQAKQKEAEAYQTALDRLLAELQDEAFRLDVADLKIDTDLSGFNWNLELPDLE